MAGEIQRLLSVSEAADRLGVSPSFLNKARSAGDGPPFVKIGARVAYDQGDLVAWLDRQKRTSTARHSRDSTGASA
ncbi:helix-turn-helix transcriptional regulator [Phenylobacterium sp.]|uniref:helix-turn-helix transcriptional regulator n=1 Tax=Phenylobacterium sp. TaxID=1871053 RepID=UPI0035B12888